MNLKTIRTISVTRRRNEFGVARQEHIEIDYNFRDYDLELMVADVRINGKGSFGNIWLMEDKEWDIIKAIIDKCMSNEDKEIINERKKIEERKAWESSFLCAVIKLFYKIPRLLCH